MLPAQVLRDCGSRAAYDIQLKHAELRDSVAIQDDIELDEMELSTSSGEGEPMLRRPIVAA